MRDIHEVWKTVKIGTGTKDFRRAIKNKGMKIGIWADDILNKKKFTVALERTDVSLVVLSVKELGFKNGARIRDIYKAAKKLGLELCPNEVGPQLRLQYHDQPMGEWIIIGMAPITDSNRLINLFRVEHNEGGLWLFSDFDYVTSFWGGDDCFAFVVPRE